MIECDHIFEIAGTVTTKPLRDYVKTWERYCCRRCLKQRYVLIEEYNEYTGSRTYTSGSEVKDSLSRDS